MMTLAIALSLFIIFFFFSFIFSFLWGLVKAVAAGLIDLLSALLRR